MQPILPECLADKLRGFLLDRKTGSITLDVRDGEILGWKITESGRLYPDNVDKRNGARLS